MLYENKPKKVLITGSTGLLGSHVLRKLLENEDYVPIAMVRTVSQKQACEKIGIEAVIGDLLNLESLHKIRDQDYYGVVHCAALAGDWVDKDQTFKINVLGTEHLVNTLSDIKVFIHISTIGVYGHKPYHNATEERKYRLSSHYENSKIQAEKVIKRAVEANSHIKYIIIRPPTMYGENDRHFFPRLLKYIRQGKFKFVGYGKIFFPLIHAEDAANAILSALSTDSDSGTAYHISGPEITLREFINELSKEMDMHLKIKTYPYSAMLFVSIFYEIYGKLLNKEPIMFRKRIRYLGRSRHINSSKAKLELDFIPEIKTKEGIKRTLVFFMEEESIRNIKAKLSPLEQYLKEIPYFFIYILEKISASFSSEHPIMKKEVSLEKGS